MTVTDNKNKEKRNKVSLLLFGKKKNIGLLSMQASFDAADGLHRIAPLVASNQDSITQLAGLHILASVIYSPHRDADILSGQLQTAGLYDALLALLLMPSDREEEQERASNRGCLDWLETSLVGSHMASVPEGCPVGTGAPCDWSQSVCSGHTTAPQNSNTRSAVDHAYSEPEAWQDCRASKQSKAATEQHNAACGGDSVKASQTQASTLIHSRSVSPSCSAAVNSSCPHPGCRKPYPASTPPAVATDFEASDHIAHTHVQMSRDIALSSGLQEQAAGTAAGRSGIVEEPELESSRDLDLVDQVMCAALEVLCKLASSPVHLQACRYVTPHTVTTP